MQTDTTFSPPEMSLARRYGIGLLAAAGSIAVRVALMPLLGTRPPYITFYLGTVVAAAYGGMGPGLLVVAIGLVFGFVVLPAGPVVFEQEAARLVLYISSGVGICLIADAMHRQRRRVLEQAEALKEERAKLLAVVETLDVGVLIVDRSGGVVSMNPAALRLHGFASSAEIPNHTRDFKRRFEMRDLTGRLMPPEERPVLRALHGDFFDHLELHACDSTTGREWIGSWSAAPVRNVQGEVQLLVFTVNDITEQKRAEAVLKREHTELERMVRERTEELRGKELLLEQQSRQAAMGEMVNNIAHQWRQPLNMLGLLIQSLHMLQKSGDRAGREMQDTTDKAMDIIRHMSQTVDDFRDYFKPDKERVPFHATQLIHRTIKLTEAYFQALDIAVEVVAPVDPVIVGYPNQFGQVLLNLLLNARDAMVERQVTSPRISITVGAENDKTVITIADNGGGIPEDIIDRIFEPYFTTKGPEQGTGIGLYMSKSIIEKNMGGRIVARNAKDGAEFRIEI